VMAAYYTSVGELTKGIQDPFLKQELTNVVKYLCNPLPENRGFPKNLHDPVRRYNLEQFVTKLDILHQKARFQLIKG
jgi:hypothetical protein